MSFVREGLTFSSPLGIPTVTFGGASFGTNSGQTGTLQRLFGSTWIAENHVAAGDTSVSFAAPTIDTTRTYRIVFDTGTDIAYGEFTVTRTLSGMTTTGLG